MGGGLFFFDKFFREEFFERCGFGELELFLHQVGFGGRSIGRFFYEIDDLIDIADGEDETFDDVGAVLAFFK